jgi:dTMP kinase
LFAKENEFIYFDIEITLGIVLFMFITFEGLDYSGKSTQVRLLSDTLTHKLYHILVLREPGGTEVGEKIRAILLDKKIEDLTTVAELFLFSASRAQLVAEVIKPALEGGLVVLCDRFYDSLTAYQGWGKGISTETVRVVNQCASSGLVPDITFFLDIPVAEVERRMRRSRNSKDRMESNGIAFYERARQGYLDIAKKESRFRVLDGSRSIDTIHEEIWNAVSPRLVKP